MTTTRPVTEEPDTDEDQPAGGGIPHRKLILAAIVVVVLALVATWLVAFSSVFGVGTITVRGTHQLAPSQVRAAARITGGQPLVRLDTAAVRRRVETLPDVASASVTTSFPSTVIITVDERTAVGTVELAGGYGLIDRNGVQFRSETTRPAHLPLFVLPRGSDAARAGRAVATVAADLPADLRARISSIQAFDQNAITLLLRDHRVVAWGSAADSALKARILPALLKQDGQQFDVTDPAQPFTR